MSSVPMPRDLSEEAVAEWLYVNSDPFNESRVPWGGLYDGERNKWRFLARAVRSLVEQKVREAVVDALRHCESSPDRAYRELGEPLAVQQEIESTNAIVSRVLGEEAPRG